MSEYLDAPLPLARGTDPETSKYSATVMRPGSQRLALLRAYRGSEVLLTDREAAAIAGLSHTGYWKRCSDLRELGLIEPVGEATDPITKRPVMTCQVTELGAGLELP